MAEAIRFKEEGNVHFLAGDYISAEGLYSKAIIADPKNHTLYTNRAMSRLKLSHWDSVISDCQTCVDLSPTSMKAHYYLAQAHLALCDPEAALPCALRAHELCAAVNDRSLGAVTALVLRCKHGRWEACEKRRVREAQEVEREVMLLFARDRDEALEGVAEGDEVERSVIGEEYEAKVKTMTAVFERSRAEAEKRREMPDWVIDDISFGVMVDPVITKTGKSYERASIMEHLRCHPTDPLTREPLRVADLRPNLALRQACEEFLEHNGWAVDW